MTDFSDLEDLLKESVLQASAKKAKAQGKKLSTSQAGVIAEMKAVEERALWETKATYTHVRITTCSCGKSRKAFMGWYAYQEARYGSGRQLKSVPYDIDLDYDGRYYTHITCDVCPTCSMGYMGKVVTALDCDLLLELDARLIKAQEATKPSPFKSDADEISDQEARDLLKELDLDSPLYSPDTETSKEL